MNPLLRIAVATTLVFVSACGSNPAPPPPSGGGKPVDPATAGALSGRVVYSGTPPAIDRVKMGTDMACVQGAGPNPQSDAVLIAADGGLKNAFVHIKEGIDPAYSFDIPASAVMLDQKGCIYTPRVLGIRAGQPLEVINSDNTLHNVHALPMANQEFNRSTPVRGSRMTETFTVPEVMVRFKCNVHGWMSAYVGVMAHPFFAVTDATGAFEIKGVPPGTYTVDVWHEKFGTRTERVTIGERQAQTVSFTFTGVPETKSE